MRVGSRADGRTDMTKLIVVFRNTAIAPKSYCCATSQMPSLARDVKPVTLQYEGGVMEHHFVSPKCLHK